MLKISKGVQSRPVKAVIYGPEGIGKSTITSKFPDVLFIDTEGGTSRLDVSRTQVPQSWTELLEIVDDVYNDGTVCKTLALDTADWAEGLCIKHVCEKYQKKGIEEFGYGKGYVYLSESFRELLDKLSNLIDIGINVVITAHAHIKKFEQPDEMGAYDRWEMKLTKHDAPLLKEWADMLLFANYETMVVKTDNDKNKAQGGKRVMFASHSPCWDAKNRYGLPDKMELDFSNIAHLFENTESLYAKLSDLMATSQISVDDIHSFVRTVSPDLDPNLDITEYPPKMFKQIIDRWNFVVETINKNKIKEDVKDE